MTATPSTPWTLTPGETILRTELHDTLGGSRQAGISHSVSSPNIFIFSGAASGHRHGYYDEWVGDVFHYTGEGQFGDQKMTVGNKALLEHRESGRAVHVFDGATGVIKYVGEFEVD